MATYFCTPSGRVINAVLGPVDADELIREAQWAIDTIRPVQGTALSRQIVRVDQRRRERTSDRSGLFCRGSRRSASKREDELHTFLEKCPLAYLDRIYDHVFEHILDEELSTAGLTVAQAGEKMALAKKSGRPLLFVVHEQEDKRELRKKMNALTSNGRVFDRNMKKVLSDFIVITIEKDQQAALSHLVKQRPYESPNGKWPLFVVAKNDGTQVDANSGCWCGQTLANLLATNWVDAVGERKMTPRQIKLAKFVHGRIEETPDDKFDSLLETATFKTVRF